MQPRVATKTASRRCARPGLTFHCQRCASTNKSSDQLDRSPRCERVVGRTHCCRLVFWGSGLGCKQAASQREATRGKAKPGASQPSAAKGAPTRVSMLRRRAAPSYTKRFGGGMWTARLPCRRRRWIFGLPIWSAPSHVSYLTIFPSPRWAAGRLSSAAPLPSTRQDGDTVLHSAAKKGMFEVMRAKLLLDNFDATQYSSDKAFRLKAQPPPEKSHAPPDPRS